MPVMTQPQNQDALKVVGSAAAFADIKKQFDAIIGQDNNIVDNIDAPTNKSITTQCIADQGTFTFAGDGNTSVFRILPGEHYKGEKFQVSVIDLTTYRYVQISSRFVDRDADSGEILESTYIEISIDPPPVNDFEVTLTLLRR